MTLTLINCESGPVTLYYRDAQRYEFEAQEADALTLKRGEVVWRWSADRLFVQVLRQETLEPAASITYSEVWDQRADSGEQVRTGTYFVSGLAVGCTDEALRTCGFADEKFVSIEAP